MEVTCFPGEPGTYALVMCCSNGGQVRAGRLGLLQVVSGWYIYVGSAFGPGGLRGRLAHHLDSSRPQHWHVDALKPLVDVRSVWLTTDSLHLEHNWASACLSMPGITVPWPRFGASDCSCRSHLFYSEEQPEPGPLGPVIRVIT